MALLSSAQVCFRQVVALGHRLRDRVSGMFLYESWMIGWIDQPIENSINWNGCPPVRWIGQRSLEHYLADPFAWPGQTDVILCERYDLRSRTGTLRSPHIDGESICGERPVILSVPGHLSFPFMFQNDGATYLIPESCAARRLTIFRWNSDERAWLEFVTPMTGTAAADSILFEHNGYFWIAYTDVDLDRFDNLNLCYASSLEGPWHKHEGNPVKRDSRRARCGGTPFRIGERLYRPVQDCAECYGGAIRIMEIVDCSPTTFREREIALIPPERGINPHGLHTLAAWGNRCLVDGKRVVFSPRLFARRVLRYASRMGLRSRS